MDSSSNVSSTSGSTLIQMIKPPPLSRGSSQNALPVPETGSPMHSRRSSFTLAPLVQQQPVSVEPTLDVLFQRIMYIANTNTIFCNFSNISVTKREHVHDVKTALQTVLDDNNAKNVHCLINYDQFEICDPSDVLVEYYSEHVVRFFVNNYYHTVQRYTTQCHLHDAVRKLQNTLLEKNLDTNMFYTDAVVGDRFIVEELIGEGAFGVVKLGTDRLTGSRVAIKQISLERVGHSGHEYVEFLQREERVLKQVAYGENTHKNICSLVAYLKDSQSVYIVMEYCGHGPLETPFEEHEVFEEHRAHHYFTQIIDGLEYLHESHRVIHRDLQLQNICTDENDQVKICDFSVSDYFTPGVKSHNRFCGASAYAHPDMMLTTKPYEGPEVDVWSSGVCLYKMLTGYLPFRTAEHTLIGRFRIPLEGEDQLSEEVKDLLQRMLAPKEKDRLTISQIKQHSWWSKY